jgi:hypothetical protein
MIPINDMFRLGSSKQSRWNVTRWHLEEWKPGTRIEGAWHRASERMSHAAMDFLLEQMMCPTGPHAAFRAAETRVLPELPIGGVRAPRCSVRNFVSLTATA